MTNALTPNHRDGEPLAPIDAERLRTLARRNVENPDGGRRKIRTTPRRTASSATTPLSVT